MLKRLLVLCALTAIATAVLAVTALAADFPPADITVSLLHDKLSYKVGDTVTYSISVGNNGPGSAQGVTVTDLLPDNITLGSASFTNYYETLPCTTRVIAAGDVYSYAHDTQPNYIGRTLVTCTMVEGASNQPAGTYDPHFNSKNYDSRTSHATISITGTISSTGTQQNDVAAWSSNPDPDLSNNYDFNQITLG